MKDKVIKLKTNREFYILDELTITGRKFVFGIECNTKAETTKNEYIVKEVKLKNDKLYIDNIENEEEIKYISNLFLENLKKNTKSA